MPAGSGSDGYGDAVTALAAAKERRLSEIERDIGAVTAGQAALGEVQVGALRDIAVHAAGIAELKQDVLELKAELKDIRTGQRNLVLAILGFAFTVAGSSVGLALALGGHP